MDPEYEERCVRKFCHIVVEPMVALFLFLLALTPFILKEKEHNTPVVEAQVIGKTDDTHDIYTM